MLFGADECCPWVKFKSKLKSISFTVAEKTYALVMNFNVHCLKMKTDQQIMELAEHQYTFQWVLFS